MSSCCDVNLHIFGPAPIKYIEQLQTTLLNGILFLGSLGFLNFVLRPSLRHAAFLLSGDTESQATWLFTDNVVSGLFNVRVVSRGLSCLPIYTRDLFQALWLYPVYSISFVLNAIWYQEFADEGLWPNYMGIIVGQGDILLNTPADNSSFSCFICFDRRVIVLIIVHHLRGGVLINISPPSTHEIEFILRMSSVRTLLSGANKTRSGDRHPHQQRNIQTTFRPGVACTGCSSYAAWLRSTDCVDVCGCRLRCVRACLLSGTFSGSWHSVGCLQCTVKSTSGTKRRGRLKDGSGSWRRTGESLSKTHHCLRASPRCVLPPRLYYLGFGTPGALATFFFPTLISNGVFALIFPVVRRSCRHCGYYLSL